MASRSLIPHFQVGKKEIRFPKFTVTLIKSHLPSQYARFIVPLSFNKLDLRDYLFHAYNVRTLHIRSSITQGKATKNAKGQLKREASTKYMTAHLLEPFVWPAEPWVKEGVAEEEWKGFDRQTQRETEKAQRDNEVAVKYDKRLKGERERSVPSRRERGNLAEQARRLLSGQEKWRSTRERLGEDDFWKRDQTYQGVESRP